MAEYCRNRHGSGLLLRKICAPLFSVLNGGIHTVC